MLSALLLSISIASHSADEMRLDALVDSAWQAAGQASTAPPPSAPQGLKVDPKHQADIDNDVKAGKKYSAEVEKQYKLSTNQEWINKVQTIGGQMAALANNNNLTVLWGDKQHSNFNYTFKVIEDPDVNAFTLPGGFVYVNTGLMKFIESDDELAGVLGHEISHAAFRHLAVMEKESNKLQAATLPLILIALLKGGESGVAVAEGTSLFNMAKGSGWSVKAEEAADFGGFQMMIKSKYNPVAMLTFMERLAKVQRFMEAIPLGIFQTHPVTRERAETFMERLHDSGIPIKRSLASPTFRVQLKDKGKGIVEAWFDGRKLTTFGGPDAKGRADEAAARMNDFFDDVPDLYEVTTDDSTVLGKRQILFRLTDEDADAAGMSLDKLTKSAADAIRRSLYLLAYRVWDAA